MPRGESSLPQATLRAVHQTTYSAMAGLTRESGRCRDRSFAGGERRAGNFSPPCWRVHSARSSLGVRGEHDQPGSNAKPMQRIEPTGASSLPTSGHVCPWVARRNLLAVGPGRRPLNMDLLVTIIQIAKDLLGSLNPFRLFKRDYRSSFLKVWRQEPLVFRIGYVLGAVGLLLLIALAVFWLLRGGPP